MDVAPAHVQAQGGPGGVLLTAAEGKAHAAGLTQGHVAFQGHGGGTGAHVRQGVVAFLSGEGDVVFLDLHIALDGGGGDQLVHGEVILQCLGRLQTQGAVRMLDQLVDQDAAGPLVHAGVTAQARPAQPAAEVDVAVELRGLRRVVDEAVALHGALAVQNIVFRGHEGAVHGITDGIVGDAVPAVGQIPLVADLEEVRALQHELGHGGEDGADELPVLQVGGGVLHHHAAQGVLIGGHQQPVALVPLHPEDLGIPEVVLGVTLGSKEQDLLVLDPVYPVGAGGLHHALLALAAVSGVVMAGVEQMVEPVGVLHHRAGAQGGIGVGHLAVVEHHAVVFPAHQVVGGVHVDGVVALAVVVGVIEVVELQLVVLIDERHHVAHIAALGRGEQSVVHRLIGLVRETFAQFFHGFFRRGFRQVTVGAGGLFRGGGAAAAGGEEHGHQQQEGQPILPIFHGSHTFLS